MVKAFCDICGKEMGTGVGFGIVKLPTNESIMNIQACGTCGKIMANGVEKVLVKVIEKVNKKGE